jgi:alpha-galactosidase
VLLVGSLDMQRFMLDVELRVETDEAEVGSVALVYDVDGIELTAGETAALQPVAVVEGRDAQVLTEAYADRVAAAAVARVPAKASTGWCSWYSFYDRVSEADVLANLEEMRRTGYPADYVQIDDGYQPATGDWLKPNEKFPSGMGPLANAIREAEYRPGIWLAPFVLHEDSEVLKEKPEMALRTRSGDLVYVDTWLGRCAVVDCTHPASEAWLREIIGTVVAQWGYGVLKLDALAYAAQPASGVKYHAAGTTAAANLRRGLEIIREAAGSDAFILGCTCHFGPAIGLVDAMRVGPDVKAVWEAGPHPSARHAMRMTLQRNWMHGRWWANDPDCLIVRDVDTELNEAETRFLATAIALSGGMVVSGDDLPRVSMERREMALALFPPSGAAAQPVNAGSGPVPSIWRAKLDDERSLLGVLNWEDEPRWAARDELLAPGEVAFDVWNGRMAGMGDVLLRPHEGLLWQVTGPGAGPRAVGDAASLTFSGLGVRRVSGALHLENELDRPRVVAVEVRGQAFEVELEAGEKRRFQ